MAHLKIICSGYKMLVRILICDLGDKVCDSHEVKDCSNYG